MQNSVIDYILYSSENFGNKAAYDDTDNQISFRETEIMSAHIASSILEWHLFNEPILVITERNVFTLIAFLGIARAGCYYIPVDSTLNSNRINQIIEASDAKLLITTESLKQTVDGLNYEGAVLTIENALTCNINRSALTEIERKLQSNMPLYVIFTSGSTGKPKGVITSHLSLMNYIEAVDDVLMLQETDVIGNQSPLDYIAAIRDIYLPLKTGATTIIIPKSKFAMASELAETIESYHISVLCWSAAGLEVASKTGLLEELKTKDIRKILFSGSILPGSVLKEWQQHFPAAQFINQYGPTETTASCTYYIVTEEATDNTILPIGIPYKNYSIVLLDQDGNEVKDGEIGEICVSGLGVTLGYYRDKELSDKSFIQNPLNHKYREIIYKTGDLGKYDTSGMLLFCGRKDRQIKHLGHRIELEEIELAAKRIDGVDDCVATYDSSKETLFLIYSGDAEKKDIVLNFRKKMPSFMVPRKVVKVEEIPHLPNGKVDAKAINDLM